MTKAIFPGTFDPVTNGHMDIIKRASKMTDELIVGVLNNSSKHSLFSPKERVEMLKEATKDLPNVRVCTFQGLLVDFARQEHACIVIRGLRAITDFEYELQMSQMNHKLDSTIETLFLTANIEYSFLSSTTVKEIASLGGDVTPFVPSCVVKKLSKSF